MPFATYRFGTLWAQTPHMTSQFGNDYFGSVNRRHRRWYRKYDWKKVLKPQLTFRVRPIIGTDFGTEQRTEQRTISDIPGSAHSRHIRWYRKSNWTLTFLKLVMTFLEPN